MGNLRLKDNRDEDLALFREMRKREKERNNLLLLQNSDEFDAPLGHGASPIFNIPSATPAPGRKTGADDFLNSDNDKNDYDWLLTPPGTPLFPSLEMEQHKTVMSQLGTPKARPTTLKSRRNTSRPSSPTIRPKMWKPSEMPGFSLDAPPNLRTSIADRQPSVTRGRPGAPGPRSSSVEPASNGRVRRQSCSPARGRPPNGVSHSSGSSVPVPAVNRLHAKANDNVSPVLVGTKMVERVINMRKLAPPRMDDKNSPRSNLSGKSSSPDSSGFGRTLSKKSLDMAIRHMDIRRTIPGNLRPLMTNIPASSMYSVRSGPPRRNVSALDSPVATSSNASSEVSVNNNALCMDGHEVDDDVSSDKGIRSPASLRGR
ncbi:Unknown protein [Striga hermonthica]|uniref:Uncharacterized protein n=1 Tax=Striga hermonthica TaxID=68872 RepID=A0A9N7NP68_STRHE|nr:Unknown protein [Striga hermonthica]